MLHTHELNNKKWPTVFLWILLGMIAQLCADSEGQSHKGAYC